MVFIKYNADGSTTNYFYPRSRMMYGMTLLIVEDSNLSMIIIELTLIRRFNEVSNWEL